MADKIGCSPSALACKATEKWIDVCKAHGRKYTEPEFIAAPEKVRYIRENHAIRCPTPSDPLYELDVEYLEGDDVLNQLFRLEEKGVPPEQIVDLIGIAAAVAGAKDHYEKGGAPALKAAEKPGGEYGETTPIKEGAPNPDESEEQSGHGSAS